MKSTNQNRSLRPMHRGRESLTSGHKVTVDVSTARFSLHIVTTFCVVLPKTIHSLTEHLLEIP